MYIGHIHFERIFFFFFFFYSPSHQRKMWKSNTRCSIDALMRLTIATNIQCIVVFVLRKMRTDPSTISMVVVVVQQPAYSADEKDSFRTKEGRNYIQFDKIYDDEGRSGGTIQQRAGIWRCAVRGTQRTKNDFCSASGVSIHQYTPFYEPEPYIHYILRLIRTVRCTLPSFRYFVCEANNKTNEASLLAVNLHTIIHIILYIMHTYIICERSKRVSVSN